jgi:glycosyltransferase involved in cell wall biosynthesis
MPEGPYEIPYVARRGFGGSGAQLTATQAIVRSTLWRRIVAPHQDSGWPMRRGTGDSGATTFRVLEIVINMQVGGIERWLLDVVPRVDRKRLQLDFACLTISDANRDRLLSLGCNVHVIPDLLHPSRGFAAMRRLNAQDGPYDAVHAHLQHMTGLLLWMARRCGIRVRIAHSHLDSRPVERNAARRFLVRNAVLAALIRRHATAGLACSSDAAASLYGPRWKADGRWRLLYYGIDLMPFRAARGGTEARLALGIPAGALVVGNIARFVPQKNHALFVQVATEVARREPSAHFLLLGDEGPLRVDTEQRIAAAGLTSRFHIVAGRTDIAEFTPAMDVFLFPSVYEGLGLAVVEAQAGGVPCVITDSLPAEVDVVPQFLRRVALDAPPVAWADAVLATWRPLTSACRDAAREHVAHSAFNIEESTHRLQDFYCQQLHAEV